MPGAVALFDVLIKDDECLPNIARMDGLSDLEGTLKSTSAGSPKKLQSYSIARGFTSGSSKCEATSAPIISSFDSS